MRPAVLADADDPALCRHAEAVVDGSRYLVLATSTLGGTPWATPVYFANSHPWTFWWISAPETRHCRNLTVNPQVALAVFDSTVEFGAAAAVYVEAWAEQCPAGDLATGIAAYDSRSCSHGGERWDEPRVTGSSRLRLYRARASTVDVLNRDQGPDRRIRVWSTARAFATTTREERS